MSWKGEWTSRFLKTSFILTLLGCIVHRLVRPSPNDVVALLLHAYPNITFNHRYYLNQGAQRWCDNGRSSSGIIDSAYCRWESWFIADISEALAPLDPERVGVLFVKRAAADAVLVQFRLGEPSDYATEMTVDEAVAELLGQIRNSSSALFAGNVTVSVDPTWGLSGEGGVMREYSPHLPHDVGIRRNPLVLCLNRWYIGELAFSRSHQP